MWMEGLGQVLLRKVGGVEHTVRRATKAKGILGSDKGADQPWKVVIDCVISIFCPVLPCAVCTYEPRTPLPAALSALVPSKRCGCLLLLGAWYHLACRRKTANLEKKGRSIWACLSVTHCACRRA